MSKQWQLRRGTTVENNGFTGAQGELTMDTDKNQIRLHDGVTQGGIPFGDTVIEWQVPTAENNYTWYRKYRSGWVEQGGIIKNNSTDGAVSVTFPIEMADTNYYRNASLSWTTNDSTASNSGAARAAGAWQNPTTTTIEFQKQGGQNSFLWEIKGMAAN